MRKDTILEVQNDSPSAKIKRPPPYHVYEHKGQYFIYLTAKAIFFEIDAPTKEFLDLCLIHSLPNAAEFFKANSLRSSNEKETIIKEVKLMGKNGLFIRPSFTIPKEIYERQLKKRYDDPWNRLELSLSERCNLACKYCYCATVRDMPNKGLMTKEVAQKAVEWLFAVCDKNIQVSITLFGGEPLLNKDVLKFVVDYSQDLAKKKNNTVFYSMTTNGTLLDDEIITYIKKYNFGLMVSLDGPKELHDRQCPTQGGIGSFDKASVGIKKLMSRRKMVTVRGTMIHPIPNMLNLIKFYENFGFTRIVLGKSTNPVNPSGVDCNQEDYAEYFRQEEEELIPWMLEKLKKGETPKYYPYSNLVKMLEDDKLPTKAEPFKCGACRGTTTVGADGTLYPCHRFVGMKSWIIGHINNGPDREKCKNFWRSYREAVAQKCDSCWQRTLCKGPCPWEIAKADGTFREPYTCEHSERFIKNAAYVFAQKKKFEELQPSAV